jgi:alpha-tubulin suppressor-like RCC1 family protein
MRPFLSAPFLPFVRRVLSGALVALTGIWGCNTEPTAPAQPDTPLSAAAIAAAPTFKTISTGTFGSCGITTDSRVFCWSTSADGLRGSYLQTSLQFRQVSVGGDHMCGLTEDNLAYCWGSNLAGQLGNGTSHSSTSPVAVLGGRQYLQIRAGDLHTCAVTLAHDVFCWGDNTFGQVGDGGTVSHRFRPVKVAGGLKFIQVVAGSFHTCGATTDNRGFCWGWAGEGQIGDGKIVRQRSTPRAVAGGLAFRFLTAGNAHSCGLTTDNRAFCWGNNDSGRLGDGTTHGRLAPVAVADGHTFNTLSAGGDHTCGVSAHVAYCWGNNATGQIGDGTKTDRLRPKIVSGGLQFDGVDAAAAVGESSFTCGVTTTNRAYCWGWNQFGTLGDGTNDDSSVPVAVVGP